ncbi:hypothetical protein ACGFZR_22565 [Streptomyces sp. NPDC048241]|uniref:hypothetical protein n=1 Tax=Streptomyces sp. NPDC048241 TaxID=3365521 RepID=UPI0037171D0D
MFGYWFAALRRSARAALVVTLLVSVLMAGVLIAEDPSGWTALLQAVGAGVGWGVVFACVTTTSNTFHAARNTALLGLPLDARAASVPSVRRFTLPVTPGTTAYQLTDAVLDALQRVPGPRAGEVTEFTHGRLALTYGPLGGVRVTLGVTLTVDGGRASVEMTARPVGRRKKLDGGASWAVLTATQPVVRQALLEEAVA